MRTRRFGRTELQIPVISCGGMRYQHSWKDVPWAEIPGEEQKNLEATIHRALELGINHIETARGYGTSEMQLGLVLEKLPRGKIIVQTKIAPAEREDFLKTFEVSMKNLRMDYVDLLSVHGINNAELLEQTMRKGGALEACRELQRSGRVRHVGFSTHAPLDVILKAMGTGEFDYVNLHWYFFNRKNEPALALAKEKDMGVFIISPNDKGGMLYKPPEKLRELCGDMSPMVFNDLFCLARQEVHTLSLGAARPSDFDEHMRAVEMLDKAETMSAPIAARIEKTLRDYHGEEWMAHWEEGLPSWEDAPGQVNVWEILRLWTLATALDMVEFGKMRYNLLGQGDHWHPGNTAAEFDETEMLRACAENRFAEKIPKILREAHALLSGEQKKRLSQE